MPRLTALSLSAVLLATTSALAQEGSFKGLSFASPAGWSSSTVDGRLRLAPANVPPSAAVVVLLHGAEDLNGKSLEDWFRVKLAADLTGGSRLQEATPQSGRSGSLITVSGGRTVQDAGGAVRLQIYHSISDGKQAALALATTTSEAAMTRYITTVRTIFQGLHFSGTSAAPANSHPAAATAAARGRSANTPPVAATTRTEIAVADIVGSWEHSTASYADYVSGSTGARTGSTTIAYAQGFTFAADGNYTHLFTGMINSRYIRETDSGTWGFQGGNLVTRSRERSATKVYQIVGYQTAPDGTVFMTLLAESYPRTEGNIGLYGERYVRKPKPRPAG